MLTKTPYVKQHGSVNNARGSWRGWVATLVVSVVLAGCATTNGPSDERDPLERYNRTVFRFNDVLDRNLFKPVAQGYRRYLPTPFNIAISNFFANLGDVGVAANNLLQLKVVDAASDVGRIAINSTLGFGGLFDVGSRFGLRKHEEDFGQTLGYWGVPAGPYLILPLFGPSTVRDTPGRVVDGYLDPLVYLDGDVERIGLVGLRLLDYRADLLSTEETLNEIALDRYIALKNAFLDRREFLVHDGNPPLDEDLIKELELLE
ncbi:MAG: VacJ family lipoprotein [Gammaproteobacteria bacterium]|nr:VacJ family lipoprotein [Gammaproteobacteria bacterium]